MITICITIVLCVLIVTLGFIYYTKYHSTIYRIDDKVYKDRLLLLKDKYNQAKDDFDDEDDSVIPISIRQLINLVHSITNRVY